MYNDVRKEAWSNLLVESGRLFDGEDQRRY